MLPTGAQVKGWYVTDNSGERSWWSADTHRVEVVFGTAIISRRIVQSVISGDNDIPERVYGSGSWAQVQTVFENPPIMWKDVVTGEAGTITSGTDR